MMQKQNIISLQQIYKGLFINLEKSKNRYQYIVKHLKELGLYEHFTRVVALSGENYPKPKSNKLTLSNNEKACYWSHMKMIENCIGSNKHIHIIEDDVCMHKDTKSTIYNLLCKNNFDDFDIIFMGVSMGNISKQIYANAKANDTGEYRLYNLNKSMQYAGAYSYIINKNSIEKIFNILNKSVFDNSIDLILRKFADNNQIKTFCIMPMLSKPNYIFESTIDLSHRDRTQRYNISKEAFSGKHFEYIFEIFYKDVLLKNAYENIILFLKNKGYDNEKIKNPSIDNLIALLIENKLARDMGNGIIYLYADPKI